MRRVLTLAGMTALILGFTQVAAAQADGQWINLFDGETTFGWADLGDVSWSVKDGVLTGEEGTGGLLATTAQFADFELEMKIKVKPECSTGIAVRTPLDGHPTENGAGVIWIKERRGDESPWHDVKVVAKGDTVTATIDGEEVEDFATSNAKGHIAVLYHHNGHAVVEVSEAKLRPLSMRSIFNGENLDGWNIIPDRASEFSVIDGALNIKDGNGQIETEETFRDFVLQLDIYSNGEHLNSGVFFRGPVGVFWKGYESQVRNQWAGDDRTKPIDYGTGGNYGNQATRKVIPSDKEWFSKTVICNGNHMAVWINGILVSDFLDTRPINENHNAKEGYVPIKGTIHLQGHDPTTDLSFKNIVVQAYPED